MGNFRIDRYSLYNTIEVNILFINSMSFSFHLKLQPPHPKKQHGTISGYYLGYKVSNSSEPFRYQTLDVAENSPVSICRLYIGFEC